MDVLVGYLSSDEEIAADVPQKRKVEAIKGERSTPEPPAKKRKLPTLSSSFTASIPVSDPSKHQGRIRTHPHIDGQFASYVYIPVALEAESPLSKLVERIFKFAKTIVPILNLIIPNSTKAQGDQDDSDRELHVSLTRPVYLRHHQRDSFRNAVRQVAKNSKPFSASFATFGTFENDEKTRAFLALEIGAGHSELRQLVNSLIPVLQSLYQQEYYSEPRFHASIAWVLLKTCSSHSTEPISLPEFDIPVQQEPPSEGAFPTIPEFPPNLLPSLRDKTGEKLLQRGVFNVTQIKVKIGKDVRAYPLGL